MRKTIMLTLVPVLLFLGLSLQAAGVRKVSLEECAREADGIFVGTVVDYQARWGESGKLIWTDYLFQVHDTWKGAPAEGLRIVSVGGGAMGDRAILLTEVPSFELGGTYAVYAYDNSRLIAEAVVGVEQGLFRKVSDAQTGQDLLIDSQGYRMEVLADGCIVHGRLTERVGDTQKARVLTDEELVDQQVAFEREYGPAPIDPPVVRDAAGNVIATGPAPPMTPRERALEQVRGRPQGAPLTLESLKAHTLAVLGLAAPQTATASPAPAGPEGGK